MSTLASTTTIEPPSTVPSDADAYYSQLTSRNHHFIPSKVQARLRQLRILIAGCGSTGGACIEPLARVGVERFTLADNGDYELVNFNRQHVRIEGIGRNKAAFHKDEVLAINPFARVTVDTHGITPQNAETFCRDNDLVFDAVDVTTASGIAAKIALHVAAHAHRKPVLSALDIGYRQWGMSFDYRDTDMQVLAGRLGAARAARHPIRALFEMYSLDCVPDHALQLVLELLEGRTSFASQLGCASDMLSAIIVPVIVRFVERAELAPGWDIDLHHFAAPLSERMAAKPRSILLRRKIARLLRTID